MTHSDDVAPRAEFQSCRPRGEGTAGEGRHLQGAQRVRSLKECGPRDSAGLVFGS